MAQLLGKAWHGGSLVGLVDVLDGQDGQVAVVSEIPQSDSHSGLEANLLDGLARHIKGYGHAEEGAIGETVLLDDSVTAVLAWGSHRSAEDVTGYLL